MVSFNRLVYRQPLQKFKINTPFCSLVLRDLYDSVLLDYLYPDDSLTQPISSALEDDLIAQRSS